MEKKMFRKILTINRQLRIAALVFVVFGALSLPALSQDGSVGIGDPAIGDFSGSAILYLNSTDKGFLAPRVTLIALDDNTNPVLNPEDGLLVYNNAGALKIGLYYWDDTAGLWKLLEVNGDAWNLVGNTGTNPGTDYIGTTDAAGLSIRTNATERIGVTAAGDIDLSLNAYIGIDDGNQLRFEEPGGANYSSFQAQAQSGNLTYTLPDDYPATTGFLQSDNAGALDWIYSAVVDPGTANNQTLYWDGDSWAPSSYLSNDGTTVGIGTGPFDDSAILDMSTTDDQGVLFPNVPLTGLGDVGTISGGNTDGLFVYSDGGAGVDKGYYFWDATAGAWSQIATSGTAWMLEGNTGTNPGTDYIGTTDAAGLSIRTNATERIGVTAAGDIDLSLNAYIGIDDGNQLRFEEPGGANYSSFQAQAQSGNLTYTLPDDYPATTGFLQSDNAGALDWIYSAVVDPGTANNQTLYWDGDSWAPSSYLSNDGTTVGIGTGPFDDSAILDMSTTDDQGVLFPNVPLTGLGDVGTISGGNTDGLFVYSDGGAGVDKGYYFWDATAGAWSQIATSGTAWMLEGNTGTNPGTDYIGTTDAAGLSIRTNATERIGVTAAGDIDLSLNAYIGIDDGNQLRFEEPGGANYSSFQAQAQSGNLTYTLPDDYPATTGFLQSNNAGALDWIYSAVVDPGTANNQTLYWDGDSWAPSSYLSNDGTTVGIGTGPFDDSAILDMSTTDDQGVLFPNVPLTGLGDVTNITGGNTDGLFVYSDGNAGVEKGYYYWDATAGTWVQLANSSTAWMLAGNTGTNPGTDYIGTTDAAGLSIRTSATERIGVTAAGDIDLSLNAYIGIDDGNQLRFEEPGGANYSSFQAQAQSGNLTYTLPDDYPATTGFLQSDNTGALDWIYSAVVDPGTANNQTLYWDGDSWAPSSYLSNDGTTVTIGSDGTDGQLSIFSEQGGTDYSIIFQPNALMTETTTYTFPPAYGNAGQVLTTDASGNLSWGDAPDDGDWLVAGNNMTSIPPGNVGIGTLGIPTDKLDVDNGNFRLSNTTGTAQLIMETAAGANTTAFQTVAQPLGNIVYSLPPSLPLAGQTGYLRSDENGILSWESVATIPAGTSSNQTLRWDGSDWVTSDFMTNNDSQVQIGDDGEGDGVLVLYNDQVGTDYNVTFQPNPAMTESTTYTLPDSYGSAGQVLTTDASGNLSWTSVSDQAWMLTGNSGTDPSTNFIGTTDAQDLVFRTSDTEAMRILSDGNVGIGTASPSELLEIEDGNILISNTTNTAGTLSFEDGSGSGYLTNFSASNQTDDIDYYWPAAQASSSTTVSVLRNDGTGQLSWIEGSNLGGSYVNVTVTPVGSDYTATLDDFLIVISSVGRTVTLPTASSAEGKVYYIRISPSFGNNDDGYITRSGSDQIAVRTNLNTATLSFGNGNDDFSGALLVSDGIDTWYVIATMRANQ
jgi:hypothetical protein